MLKFYTDLNWVRCSGVSSSSFDIDLSAEPYCYGKNLLQLTEDDYGGENESAVGLWFLYFIMGSLW